MRAAVVVVGGRVRDGLLAHPATHTSRADRFGGKACLLAVGPPGSCGAAVQPGALGGLASWLSMAHCPVDLGAGGAFAQLLGGPGRLTSAGQLVYEEQWCSSDSWQCWDTICELSARLPGVMP